MVNALIEGFRKGIRPPADLPAAEWVGRNVRLGSWARSPQLDLAATPWMVKAFELAEGNETRVMVLRWPTGSGKSTYFEGLIAWIVGEDPGPTQCSHKTDDQSKRWVETRAVKVLELSDPTREVLNATHRHQKRKLELLLPHMFILFGGANIGKLQDVSIQWVLGQECWEWEPGMLGEAKARTHDRWNSREIYCGQGSVVGHDFANEDADCEQWDWAFECPECRQRVLFLPGLDDPCAAFEKRMVWDEEIAGEEDLDWGGLARSVRMRCDCGAVFKDETQVRRGLTAGADYISRGNKHKPAQVTLSFPKMAVWWVPWAKTVERYLTAKRAADKGDNSKLRQFVQKDLARHYEEPSELVEVSAANYSRTTYMPPELEDGGYGPAPKWVDEAHRFLCVDVQKNHFWAIIRAWKLGGDSRLIWEGKVSTIEGVRDLQLRYGVPNWCVAVDARYRPEDVARWAVRFGGESVADMWTMLMGEDAVQGYPVQSARTVDGKRKAVTVYRPFSHWVKARTSEGVPYRFIKHSNLKIKDRLAGLIASEEVEFDVMEDHSDDYASHMTSEVKRELRNGWRWEKVRPHLRNDLWDCECMSLVMACIKGVLRLEFEEKTGNE